jgi:glycerol-3-phosphate dehydrogenase (NAD(P)+)
MKISVVGSGSYGTAFASILAANPAYAVTLFSRSAEQVRQINENAKNPQYLDNIQLSPRLRATLDLNEINGSDYVFLALPSGALQNFIDENIDNLKKSKFVVNLAKGFISTQDSTIPEYLREKLGSRVHVGALKGPTFAADMLHSPLSAVTISAYGTEAIQEFKCLMMNSGINFDVISNIDTLEFLSILKNVYAIAIGIVEAKFKGPNARAAIFTQCAIEMQQVCSACTNESVNILKYAGIGDLLLTSLNDQSRNRTLGLMIGKGFISPAGYDKSVVVEGLRSVKYVASKIDADALSRAKVLSTLNQLICGELAVGDFIRTVLHQGPLADA